MLDGVGCGLPDREQDIGGHRGRVDQALGSQQRERAHACLARLAGMQVRWIRNGAGRGAVGTGNSDHQYLRMSGSGQPA